MSAKGNGSTQYLATAATITIPAGSYSYSYWHNPDHVPATGGITSNPMGLDQGGGTTCDIGSTYDHPSASFYRSFAHLNGDLATATRVQMTVNPPANAWTHYTVVWNGTNLKLYVNGNLHATTAGSNPATTAPNASVLSYSSGASGFDNSYIAELTVWNVALTASEAFSLGTGTLATTIQNSAIIFYSTLNTGDPGAIGPALTNHSATLNDSYFFPTDGGLSFGGSSSGKTAFGWTTGVGMAVGGDVGARAAYGWTTSVGMGVGGSFTTLAHYFPLMVGGIAFGGSMLTASHYSITMSIGMAVGGDAARAIHATANGAVAIASGREDAFTTK